MLLRCLIGCLCVAVLPLGCSRSQTVQEDAVLIYGQAEDPKTLDPINTDVAEAVHVMTNVFDTLVTYDDQKAEIVPSLAESWETSADGLTWTFHLRGDVKFHNDDLLDAEAVKFTFERLLSESHPAVYDSARPYRSSYAMIESVEAPNPRTVVFKLKQPSAILLANLAMFPASIVSPRALAERGANFAEQPIGTGPFTVAKWQRNQQLVLKRFEGHWRGPAAAPHVVFVPVKENATRAERLDRGEIHIADSLSPVELERLEGSDKSVVAEQVGMNVAYLTMQTEHPPLNHLKVREAIWHSLDKQVLVQIGYAGHAEPAVSMVPPAMWGHANSLVDRAYDLDKAKRLMKEAAAENGFQLPVKLNFSMMNQARPYLPQPLAVTTLIKDSLREIGIELTIVGRDVNQHFDHLMAGEHDLAIAGWNSDNADPDNFLYTLLDQDNIAQAGNNLSRFRNDRYHELMLAGQQELDPEKRLAIYDEAQRIVLREAPVVPLAHAKIRTAMSRRLHGYELHPTGLVRLRNASIEDRP